MKQIGKPLCRRANRIIGHCFASNQPGPQLCNARIALTAKHPVNDRNRFVIAAKLAQDLGIGNRALATITHPPRHGTGKNRFGRFKITDRGQRICFIRKPVNCHAVRRNHLIETRNGAGHVAKRQIGPTLRQPINQRTDLQTGVKRVQNTGPVARLGIGCHQRQICDLTVITLIHDCLRQRHGAVKLPQRDE